MNLISHYWELNLLNISLLKTSNINTGHKSMIVSNKRHNLQNRTVQITGHKKTWIGTIAIRKGLKYKLSSWASLKSKDSTHTIYWLTNWNVEMLERWNARTQVMQFTDWKSNRKSILKNLTTRWKKAKKVLVSWN